MKIKAIRDLLDNTQGRFFTVEFVKKDGSLRTMNCRAGVTKHLRGGTSTVGGKEYLYTVYDVQAKGYRNINLETLKRVHLDGVDIDLGVQ